MASKENGSTISYVPHNGGKFKKIFGKKVNVSRYIVPIIYCTDLMVDGDPAAGCYNYVDKVIYINMESEDPTETFFHELFHAEIIEGGIRQHPNWCADTEEIVVEVLSRSVAFGFFVRARKR